MSKMCVLGIFLFTAILLAQESPTPKAAFEQVTNEVGGILRFVDKDYGVVLYVVQPYTKIMKPPLLDSGAAVSAVKTGKCQVKPEEGMVILVEKELQYHGLTLRRFIDVQMGTASYIIVYSDKRDNVPAIATVKLGE